MKAIGPHTVAAIVERYIHPALMDEWERISLPIPQDYAEHRKQGPDIQVHQYIEFDQQTINKASRPEAIASYIDIETRRGLHKLVSMMADPSRFVLRIKTFVEDEWTDSGSVPRNAATILFGYLPPPLEKPANQEGSAGSPVVGEKNLP